MTHIGRGKAWVQARKKQIQTMGMNGTHIAGPPDNERSRTGDVYEIEPGKLIPVEKVPGGCIRECSDPECKNRVFWPCDRIADCPLLGSLPRPAGRVI